MSWGFRSRPVHQPVCRSRPKIPGAGSSPRIPRFGRSLKQISTNKSRPGTQASPSPIECARHCTGYLPRAERMPTMYVLNWALVEAVCSDACALRRRHFETFFVRRDETPLCGIWRTRTSRSRTSVPYSGIATGTASHGAFDNGPACHRKLIGRAVRARSQSDLDLGNAVTPRQLYGEKSRPNRISIFVRYPAAPLPVSELIGHLRSAAMDRQRTLLTSAEYRNRGSAKMWKQRRWAFRRLRVLPDVNRAFDRRSEADPRPSTAPLPERSRPPPAPGRIGGADG